MDERQGRGRILSVLDESRGYQLCVFQGADRYTIERKLGSGGMATVYLAHDTKHNRKVAIKVLRPELAASLGGERFLREIEITAQLNHPNILTLIDSGAADESLGQRAQLFRSCRQQGYRRVCGRP